MSVLQQQQVISEQEYLEGELVSEIKHEYVDGCVYVMAGASMNHERICANIIRHFGNHLAELPCDVFGSDIKVRTPAASYRYPDVMVVCDNAENNDHFTQSPTILVEVISRSTRKNDEEIKRLEYMNIAALEEYVLIEQDFVDICVLRRSKNWQPAHYFLGDEITFESIEMTIDVAALYLKVLNQDMDEWRAKIV
ncbi:MAG: Uma2 family endonuclease [Psychrosphaera sp.]|nr:Uma2 family endonuclease [Psychrosphaera sp.]